MAFLLSQQTAGSGSTSGGDQRKYKNFSLFFGRPDLVATGFNTGYCQNYNNISGATSSNWYNSATTWTVPSGVTEIRVTCVGAGGGGGSPQRPH